MRQAEFDRGVNIAQWVMQYLSDPANEDRLRSIMGQGSRRTNHVLTELCELAALNGVKESEVGAAIKSVAAGF